MADFGETCLGKSFHVSKVLEPFLSESFFFFSCQFSRFENLVLRSIKIRRATISEFKQPRKNRKLLAFTHLEKKNQQNLEEKEKSAKTLPGKSGKSGQKVTQSERPLHGYETRMVRAKEFCLFRFRLIT